jgi:hypothetical protein
MLVAGSLVIWLTVADDVAQDGVREEAGDEQEAGGEFIHEERTAN